MVTLEEIGASQRKLSDKQKAVLEKNKWKPGQSGNPLGGPKKEDSLVMCLKEELEALSENGITPNARIIAQMLVAKAKMGNLKAIEMCADYITGAPSRSINLGTKEPMIIKVVNA